MADNNDSDTFEVDDSDVADFYGGDDEDALDSDIYSNSSDDVSPAMKSSGIEAENLEDDYSSSDDCNIESNENDSKSLVTSDECKGYLQAKFIEYLKFMNVMEVSRENALTLACHLLTKSGLHRGDLLVIFESVYKATYSEFGTSADDKFMHDNETTHKYRSLLACWLGVDIRGIPANKEVSDAACKQFLDAVSYVEWSKASKTIEKGTELDVLLSALSGLVPDTTEFNTSDFILSNCTKTSASSLDYKGYIFLIFTGNLLISESVHSLMAECLDYRGKAVDNDADKSVDDEYTVCSDNPARILTHELLSIYDILYQECFKHRPYGILTSKGVLYARKSGELVLNTSSVYTPRLYSFILNSCGIKITESDSDIIDASAMKSDGSINYNYFPWFHAMNVFGIMQTTDGRKVEHNWGIFRKYLEKNLIKMFSDIFNKFTGDKVLLQSRLRDVFSNCFILNEYSRDSGIRMTSKFDAIRDLNKLGAMIARNAGDSSTGGIFGLGSNSGELLNNSSMGNGIYAYTYIFDPKIYRGKILFAYKAIQDVIATGGKIDARHCILGQCLDGSNLEVDLLNPSLVSEVIVGTSGSGKGVMTLSMLAFLIASGCGFIYLDYKPDMSATLWELERQTGSKILAIDAKTNSSGTMQNPIVPVRNYPFGMNAEKNSLPVSSLHLIPYLKLIQLFCIVSDLRSANKLPVDIHLTAVLDEAEQFNQNYKTLVQSVMAATKLSKKKSEDESTEYLYAKRILDCYIVGLKNSVGDVLNTSGRKANCSFLILGQHGDPADWSDGVNPWANSLFGSLVSGCGLKISGPGSGNSTAYGIKGMTFKGASLLTKGIESSRGYFAKTGSVQSGDTGTVFKSYLVLNKNDYDTNKNKGFVADLLNNIEDSTIRENVLKHDIYNSDGTLNQRIGFAGLMQYIASNSNVDIKSTLEYGYDIIWNVMQKCGIHGYTCVEQYLYDCSMKSFFDTGSLEKAAVSGISMLNNDTPFVSKEPAVTQVNMNDPVDTPDNIGETERANSNFEPLNSFGKHTVEDIYSKSPDCASQPPVNDADDGVTDDWNSSTGEMPDGYKGKDGHKGKGVYMPSVKVHATMYDCVTGKRKNSAAVMMSAMSEISEAILQSIIDGFGSLARVHVLRFGADGVLYINDMAFKPRFSERFIMSLPVDIQDDVSKHRIFDVFGMNNILKFKNLEDLVFDSVDFAENRVKPELYLSKKKGWYSLFVYMHKLQRICIADTEIRRTDTQVNADNEKESKAYTGFNIREKLRNSFHIPEVSSSPIKRMYRSKKTPLPIKVAGTVLGVGAAFWVASLLGVFALPVGYGLGKLMKSHKK